MDKMSSFVYFLVLIFCVLRTEGQSEDESCIVKGLSGACTTIEKCPSALEDIKNRVYPQICSFKDNVPIICCVDPSSNASPVRTSAATSTPTTAATATTTTKTTTTRPSTTQRAPVATTSVPNKLTSTTQYTPEYNDYVLVDEVRDCAPLAPNVTAPKTGQVAWDKCVEYQEKYVYPCQDSVALTGGRVRGNNCKHKANQLIINGIDAEEKEFPHMTLLGYGEQNSVVFQCGGSIISESFILTAGHCTFAKGFGPVTFALVGTLRRSDTYDKEKLYGIHRIHKHIEYAPPKRYNDIALLETDRRMKLGPSVIPACLDTGSQPTETAVATGWGTLVNGTIANVLQKVKIFKFSEEECVRRVGTNRLLRAGIDTKTQMCFGDMKESKDTCQGDSGGPLQINSARINCMYVIVGVTSFGRQCGVVGEPGVYTRVQPYLSWIESVVWP